VDRGQKTIDQNMLKNYLKIALRNLWRYKAFSCINLFGLSVGLTCCLLLALYILQELSYDRYHTKADRIYRVTRDFVSPDGTSGLHLANVAPPFGSLLKSYFSDLEEVVRMLQYNAVVSVSPERAFSEERIFMAEPAFFKIFTVPVVQGSPEKGLVEPFSIMLTEAMAQKYFPGQNPMGQILRLDDQAPVKVTGVFKAFPANAHLHPDFLVSFSTLENEQIYGRERLKTNWGNNSFTTYLLFPPNYPVEQVAAQFPTFLDKHMQAESPPGVKPSSWTRLVLQKLTDIHLYSHLDMELEENGDINSVYIFSAVAVFILLIACINFMNLSTARSSLRAKEIGVRMVMGATQPRLIVQFLSESLMFALLAMLIALALTWLVLPRMNAFTGKELAFTLENGWTLGLGLLALAFGVGLLAGLYPALFLSSFQPVKVLKGKLDIGRSTISLRKLLVVLQFSISVVLLVCTAMVYKQLSYLHQKALGFDKEHIVVLPYTSQLNARYEAFQTRMLASPQVLSLGRSVGVPSDRLLNSYGNIKIQRGNTMISSPTAFMCLDIDHSFIDTYRIKLVAGRNFSRSYPTDDSMAFILNEAAVKTMGFPNARAAVGQSLEYGRRKGRLVGVLQDFHFESMHEQIQPLVFQIADNQGYSNISIKVKGDDLPQALAHMQQTWKTFLPGRPFDYKFLDDSFGLLYEAEQRQGRLFTLFAGIAILIACLGLFGLASFATEQRTKEIGIRKVLGASVSGIVGMLSKDFIKLVLLANLIACPVAWYGMHKWLQDFAYRTDISWWIFGTSALLALIIALATVGFHAFRAATANPVKALRNE
jgi:putative ABC transport system permease protein